MTAAWFRLVVSCLLAALPAQAQESPGFRLRESVLNVGGAPRDGGAPASASFRVTLAAIGGFSPGAGASASFRLDGGFVMALAPPGEVGGVRFDDETSLSWDPERSRGSYNVYADGACLLAGIPAESVTLPAGDPPPGVLFAYLVTVSNRLGEEGTLGFESSGEERVGISPCP